MTETHNVAEYHFVDEGEMQAILETLRNVVIDGEELADICSVTVKRRKRYPIVQVEGSHSYGQITFDFALEGDIINMADDHIQALIYHCFDDDYDFFNDPDFKDCDN